MQGCRINHKIQTHMKKIAIGLIITASYHWIFGQVVGPDQARQVARNFFFEGETLLKSGLPERDLQLRHVETVRGAPFYYLFIPVNNRGFILISGDYRFYPILGFSTDGTFDIEQMPPALEELFQAYRERFIEQTHEMKSLKESYGDIWEKYSESNFKDYLLKTEEMPNVNPLIQSRWNSGCSYNSFCPVDKDGPCGRVKVGCVAVAMG
jgi:hypothetical protein